MDWHFDGIRRKTSEWEFEAVNYHRFADDIVVTVSGHHTKRCWVERTLQRLCEQIEPLCVKLNMEKTKVMNMLDGGTFGFLMFDFRRILNREKNWHYILLTPKKTARKTIKAKIREIIQLGGATSAEDLIKRINAILARRVEYFRVGNSSRVFSEVQVIPLPIS